MIEEIVKSYLELKQSTPVYMEIPKNPPSTFYIVQKTGSSFNNYIYSSTITIQSYAPTKYEAAVQNEHIKDLMMFGLITDPEITKVELNSDYDYTDLSEKRYRYQAVFDITHY